MDIQTDMRNLQRLRFLLFGYGTLKRNTKKYISLDPVKYISNKYIRCSDDMVSFNGVKTSNIEFLLFLTLTVVMKLN